MSFNTLTSHIRGWGGRQGKTPVHSHSQFVQYEPVFSVPQTNMKQNVKTMLITNSELNVRIKHSDPEQSVSLYGLVFPGVNQLSYKQLLH